MKNTDVLSERRAEKIIEQFENGSRNGEQWAHDVCLHRGTEKYEKSLVILNEAFEIKSINRRIVPLPFADGVVVNHKRTRR
jgi:hypothetical protein